MFHDAPSSRSAVMHANSRPKDGVASLAYVASIHALLLCSKKDVDGRDKPGHDESVTQFDRSIFTSDVILRQVSSSLLSQVFDSSSV